MSNIERIRQLSQDIGYLKATIELYEWLELPRTPKDILVKLEAMIEKGHKGIN